MPTGSERSAALRSRAPTLLLLLLALAACAWGLGRALAWRVGLRAVLGPLLLLELLGLAVAFALVLGALLLELFDVRRRVPRVRPFAGLRRLFCVLVVAWLLFLAFVQPFQRLWFDMALAGVAGAWAGALLVVRRTHLASSRAWRVGELTLSSVCLGIVLLEGGLRGVAAVHPTPVMARVADAPRRLVERFRCRPGEVRFGFPCNASGFYDEPLTPRREGEQLVVAVGDSFNVGSVPHAWHYTTVCEERLGVPVHNLGVPGIGPPEYLHLLVEEGLPLDPSVAVVSVFIGNDLSFAEAGEGLTDARLRAWLEREQVLTWVVTRRLLRLAAERARRGERGVAAVGGELETPVTADRDQLLARMPWLADPLLEQGALSPEAFLRLETRRALEVCRGEPPSLRALFDRLSQMRSAAGATPLVVVLIPDEFQVEDELWQQVRTQAGVPLERDLPQRLVVDWLEREGIESLDLLPALRAVAPLEDGRRHVYHLRDTHFNARGNAVAGEALAEFLRPRLVR